MQQIVQSNPFTGAFGALIFLCLLLPSTGCLTGNGIETTEERDHADFTGVVVGSFADTSIVIGAGFDVSITCDGNLLRYFISEIEGNNLVIRHEQPISSVLDCKIDIEMPEITHMSNTGSGAMATDDVLQGIETILGTGSGTLSVPGAVNADGAIGVDNTGSGAVVVEGLEADTVVGLVTGSGNITMAGVTRAGEYANTGSGRLDAEDLIAETIDVSSTGSGDIIANASDSSTVVVTGSGDVVVHGNPTDRDDTNTGTGAITYP